VTLLETVLGVLLLGMVTATLAGAVGALRSQGERNRQRLAAMELANRLLLQYVDDEENLPSELLPVAYDGLLYRWRSEVRPVDVRISDAGRRTRDESGRTGFDFGRRLKVVSVSVWLAGESGGSDVENDRVPRASLSRIVDPIAFRNADSVDRRFGDDPTRMMEVLLDMTAGSAGSSGDSSGGSSGTGSGSGSGGQR